MKTRTSTTSASLAAVGSLIGLLFALTGNVQALIVGLPAAPFGNCLPFGCDIGVTRYQQIYAGAAFSDPISIVEIDFFQFIDEVTPPGDIVSGTFTMSLSTTSQSVNALDTSDMNNNVGADNTLFAVAVLTGGPSGSLLSFTGTPFLYDPTLGNLLLDIQWSGFSHSGVAAFFQTPEFSDVTSRCYGAGGPGCFTDGIGLVTQFLSTAAPEPASLALLVIGLASLAFYHRRKQA